MITIAPSYITKDVDIVLPKYPSVTLWSEICYQSLKKEESYQVYGLAGKAFLYVASKSHIFPKFMHLKNYQELPNEQDLQALPNILHQITTCRWDFDSGLDFVKRRSIVYFDYNI